MTFPQISDDPGEVFDRFGVAYQPAVAVVNTDGTTTLLPGAIDRSRLDEILAASG